MSCAANDAKEVGSLPWSLREAVIRLGRPAWVGRPWIGFMDFEIPSPATSELSMRNNSQLPYSYDKTDLAFTNLPLRRFSEYVVGSEQPYFSRTIVRIRSGITLTLRSHIHVECLVEKSAANLHSHRLSIPATNERIDPT